MAGKLFVVLFAFLAVQGWTSAGVIPDELVEFFDSSDLLDLNALEDFSWEELTKLGIERPELGIERPKLDIESKNAENCVPYIPEAYSAAKTVQKIVGQGKALFKKLKEGAKKCKALVNIEVKKKCYKALGEKAKAEGKPIIEAYKKIRPQVIKSLADFDKCLESTDGN